MVSRRTTSRRYFGAFTSAALLVATACGRDAAKEQPTEQPGTAVSEAVEPKIAPSAAPPAPAPEPSAKPAGSDPCPELCSRSRELGCSNAERCADGCREMLAEKTCSDSLRLALRCFAAQPAAHWECGDNGMAAVKDGYCSAEQARYVQCIGRATGQ